MAANVNMVMRREFPDYVNIAIYPKSNFNVLSNRLKVTIDESLREKGSRMEIDESRYPRS